MNYRSLTSLEIEQLQQQFCIADDWNNIQVLEGFNPLYVREVSFSGQIRLGKFEKSVDLPGGISVHSGIFKACLHNTTVANNVYIREIHNYIANYHIGEDSHIENTNLIVVNEKTSFGNGVRVPVMNEGGGREVPIFDGLSAHLAYILTVYRHDLKVIKNLQTRIDAYADSQKSVIGIIGKSVRIVNCGAITNVRIGDHAILDGVATLKNGTVNSHKEAPVHVGYGVACDEFILSSGVRISDSTLISRCFVGQGSILDKHFSAVDSLFFANCHGSHGEAIAVFAGPYTVSHHKATLLIAGMFSFFNAGSGSNQSNHLYKLGPVHQGVVERGCKATSDSYLLWPARIGAFTLVMGRHTKHSNTSDLPFSYLIENAGESYLVPGANLRSVGTIRDAQKWSKRDTRKDSHKLDQLNLNLWNPYTIQQVMKGLVILENLQQQSPETTEEYNYNNCIIRRSSLVNGISLYKMAIFIFLGNSFIDRLKNSHFDTIHQLREQLTPTTQSGSGEWSDLSGLLVPRNEISLLMEDLSADALTLDEIQSRFESLQLNYTDYSWTWSYHKLLAYWEKSIVEVTLEDFINLVEASKNASISLDSMLYLDAQKEFDQNSHVGFGMDGDDVQKTQDFEAVRGTLKSNPFVRQLLNHSEEQSQLAEEMIARLKMVK